SLINQGFESTLARASDKELSAPKHDRSCLGAIPVHLFPGSVLVPRMVIRWE
ncbi:unnamed protein product, partial [Pylaiella littoralis]